MNSTILFSPQMLNTFEECQAKYYFKYKKNIQVPLPENNFVLGKNIHALAAYYLKGEDVSLFDLSENELKMWNNLLGISYYSLKAELIETNISCKIDNFWIGGRIDALVKNSQEDYFILDYKTGNIPKNAEYNFQTIVYLICCEQLIKQYKSLNFVYINLKENNTHLIKFTKDKKEEYLKKLKEYYSYISKMSQPKINRDNKCTYCPYLKVCV